MFVQASPGVDLKLKFKPIFNIPVIDEKQSCNANR